MRVSGTKAAILTAFSTVVATMAVVVAPAPAQAAPPSNDDFANAQILPPGVGIYTGTNVDATTETGEPNRLVTDVPPPGNDYAPTASVWYQWTAPDVAVPPAMQVSTRGSLAITARVNASGKALRP